MSFHTGTVEDPELDRAIALNSNFALAYTDRANAWRDQGEFDRAMADHDQAIRLDPKLSFSYLSRANTRRRKGDLDGAIGDYDRAIGIDPNYAVAFYYRGNSRFDNGDFEGSIADFDRTIQLDPKSFGLNLSAEGANWKTKGDFTVRMAALLDRGIALEAKGDIARARADYSAILARPLLNENDRLARAAAEARLSMLSSGIGRRVALVVGNSSCDAIGALANPQRDANSVARALRHVGFQTVMFEADLGREKFNDALRKFARETEQADWALVYFAGHGIEMNGINYLIPIDAKLETDRDVEFEAVPLQRVMSAVEGAKRLRLVLLDACRDNPFARQMRRTLASRSVVGRGFAKVEPNAGTLVVYAAKDGEVALDGMGAVNSPFATAFVKNLATPGLEVRRLFDLVRDDVMEATNNRQQPFAYGSVSGRQDFYFLQQ